MEETISISQYDILAVFGEDVNHRGTLLNDTEKSDECVHLIHTVTDINLINSLLENIKRICEINYHFCGLEFVYSDYWTNTNNTTNLLVSNSEDRDDYKPLFKEVPIIRINSFVTGIEHG